MGVNKVMHFYACPYCDPCEKARLYKKIDEDTSCNHKKGLFGTNKRGIGKECKKEDLKCKEVMVCKKCKASFIFSEESLKQWKRKIKDG